MGKKLILILLLSNITVYSQVGINTENPKATLDVVASPEKATLIDGFIAPRLRGSELQSKNALYTTDQMGAIVFAKSASPEAGTAGDKTINIDSAGYYYFDGNLWQKIISGVNGTSYTANNGLTMISNNIKLGGVIIEPTTISGITEINKLDITATGVNAINIDNNTLSIDASNDRVGIGTTSPISKLNVRGGAINIGTITEYAGGLQVQNQDSSKPIFNAYGTDNIEKIRIANNGNMGIGTTSPSQKLDVEGSARIANKLTVGSNWTGAALAVDNRISTEPILTLSNDTSQRQMTVQNDGKTGIGTQTPTQKLDVDGNARFRGVPSGIVNSTDSYVAISSDGTLKKTSISVPGLALFANSTTYTSHPANGTASNLNFENVSKINTEYITTTAYPNTFLTQKYGLYTIEVWGRYSSIPSASDDGTRGCSLFLAAGGSNNDSQLIGSRFVSGVGTSGFTRTVILYPNEEIKVKTLCTRSGSLTYSTAPSSTIMITYMPL